MALWKIRVLRANDGPRWQTIHSFWVRIFPFQIQFIRSPDILYSILILRENWIVDAQMEKMLFESSFYGRDYGQNLCFFSKKKKKKCLPTYSNFEFEKMGTKKFFYHGLNIDQRSTFQGFLSYWLEKLRQCSVNFCH